MTEQEKACFQYGKEAVAANIRAPCYDPKMDRMVSETHTELGSKRNARNMTAWHMGRLCQELEQGAPLDRVRFQLNLAVLLPEAKAGAASVWADFAWERVDQGQYVNFTKEPDEKALCRWHETLLAGLCLLSSQYNQETAAKVCDLSLEQCCLYPYEMERAAEELRKGASPDTLVKLMQDGELKADTAKFPTLREVFHLYEQSQTLSMDMSL